MTHTQIGNFEVARVVEQVKPMTKIKTFFPELTDEQLQTAKQELPPGHIVDDDMLVLSFHSYVVKTGRYNIMVDTCCGNHKERPARPAFSNQNIDYLGTLAKAGLQPEDIDFVMCTHLHWDHVGWNTQLINGEWVPTFPNAKYIMARREYEHWDKVYQSGTGTRHSGSFEDSVLPIIRAERAVLVDDDHEVENGVWMEPCHGHTPGNVVINIRSADQQAVLSGDVIHHRVQLMYPEISASAADSDSQLSRKTRTAFIEKHADSGRILFPGHFPAPTIGRIEENKGGRGYQYAPLP